MTLSIQGVTSEGAGIARHDDGRVVFVQRSAPGDRVRAAVPLSTSRWARGRLISIEESGGARRTAPCPHYTRCGGCTLQHMDYSSQVEAKRLIVLEALRRIGHWSDLPDPRVTPSPQEFRYRNRMTFTLLRRGSDGGKIIAGLHDFESPERVIDIDGRCLLPEEPISEVWEALRREWGPGAVRLPSGADLRLTLRSTLAGKVLLSIAGGRGAGEPEELLARIPALEAIWQTFPGMGRSPKRLAGEESTFDLWEGEEIELRPTAFFQVNRQGAEPLREAVLREVAGSGAEGRVLDAYCGAGVYGRELARRGRECIGIELDPGAVRAARDGAPVGFTVLNGRVEDHLAEVLPVGTAILNPPRKGAGPEILMTLSASEVKRIVYVSCDPATLARDTASLNGLFRVSALEIFDLFPQTSHVETLLTLDRVET